LDIVVGHMPAPQVVFAGPMGVGKTTALRAVAGPDLVGMDVHSLEVGAAMRALGKSTTTAGFDYGECLLPDGRRVALYGLPGQERFDLMWDVVTQGCSGIVLWVFGNSADGVEHCEVWLKALSKRLPRTRLVVAVSRLSPHGRDDGLHAFAALARRFHPQAVVIAADPRARDEVRHVVASVLAAPSARFLAA